jgi:hypothetical protein
MKLLDITAQINGEIKTSLQEAATGLEQAHNWFSLIGDKERIAEIDKARQIIDKLLEEARAEKTSWS